MRALYAALGGIAPRLDRDPHVTRYLADRGVAAAGIDLSPAIVELARQLNADLEFIAADMRALPLADASVRGIVAFYSVIHLGAPGSGSIEARQRSPYDFEHATPRIYVAAHPAG